MALTDKPKPAIGCKMHSKHLRPATLRYAKQPPGWNTSPTCLTLTSILLAPVNKFVKACLPTWTKSKSLALLTPSCAIPAKSSQKPPNAMPRVCFTLTMSPISPVPITNEKAISANFVAVCHVPPAKKASLNASFSAKEPGNCFSTPKHYPIPSISFPTSPHTNSASNDYASANTANASDFTRGHPGYLLTNSLNSKDAGSLYPPMAHSKLCAIACF